MADEAGEVEIWGDGQQTRSFLYIEECVDGTLRLMRSNFAKPLNIGSDEMISINGLAHLAAKIAGKNIRIRNIPGPTGVRGRNSDNSLISETLLWRPNWPLARGLEQTYR